MRATGSLVVQAIKSGERTAVATGISASLSKGSTTNWSVAGSASVTTSTDDTRALLENTDVTGDVASPIAMGVQVVAYDRSVMGAGGGALSVSNGKGAAGVGAAISVVNAKGSTQALVYDGSIQQAHDLAVATRKAHTTDGGSLHVVEFLALRALGLATARGPATGLAACRLATRTRAVGAGRLAGARAVSGGKGHTLFQRTADLDRRNDVLILR
mgnify:CR=1 FL=1